jgi:DNA-binding FadR family transcriptional regulator
MLERLHRETLAERAATSLMEFVRAQDLKPGDVLPSASRLALEFGVSRPVIREALKSLQGQGVIEVINGRGAIVRSIDSSILLVFFARAMQVDRDSIIELMEVRKGIEVEGAILAAQRRTPEELARLAATVAQMHRCLHDPDAYIELDVALHLLIASASHNRMLYHLVESIREALKDSVREGLRRRRTGEQLERVQVLHEALLTELERGDPERAGRAMALHFDEAVMALIGDDAADARGRR